MQSIPAGRWQSTQGEGCRELEIPEIEGWEHSVRQFMPSSVHSADVKDYPGYKRTAAIPESSKKPPLVQILKAAPQ